ncbi:hypothetical protein [Anaerosacchariphilus polymeriproducens]|uniref:Uncharacterized protein n=1 Tax=Anaerosacchariphilus polymeriproducens TaxID=1812858 RepID=A0A371AXV9_9FIRM|nr:hypothetical protein [Anaerosacchariphilus polymeriproducens]RDU24387.1 hypothetical protein DWV06_05280 [Anaerosacchariphilus polymeriproducens]
MDHIENNKGTPSKDTGTKNKINLDYDYNTEYGDGDIPEIDKPQTSNATPEIQITKSLNAIPEIPVEMPIRENK